MLRVHQFKRRRKPLKDWENLCPHFNGLGAIISTSWSLKFIKNSNWLCSLTYLSWSTDDISNTRHVLGLIIICTLESYITLQHFLHCLTEIWFCEQPRGYQGPSQLRTQQGWFLWIDPPKELGLHHVVHKYLSCICIPQPFLINHVFCGLYVLHTFMSLLCEAPTSVWAAITKQLHAANISFGCVLSAPSFVWVWCEKPWMFSLIPKFL